MKKLLFVGALAVISLVVSSLAFFKVVTFKAPSPNNPLGAIEFNTGKITHGNLAPSVEQRRSVVVTHSQIDALGNDEDGIELIPDPGDDNVIVVDHIVARRVFASESFNRGTGESFEVKWAGCCTTASGMNGAYPLGASFSTGFLTGNGTNSRSSPSVEIWYPSGQWLNDDGTVVGGPASRQYVPGYVASSSAVHLTGLLNLTNAETSGLSDFIFEVFYRILPITR